MNPTLSLYFAILAALLTYAALRRLWHWLAPHLELVTPFTLAYRTLYLMWHPKRAKDGLVRKVAVLPKLPSWMRQNPYS